jgi:hypothetical protein
MTTPIEPMNGAAAIEAIEVWAGELDRVARPIESLSGAAAAWVG